MTAEEYIKAYTRGCSNELVGGGYHEWLTPENALAAVELAREEMMEKALTYLHNKLHFDNVFYGIVSTDFNSMEEMFEDFKNYMKESEICT